MTARFRTVAVRHHARYGVVGDPAVATEAWLILHGYGMMARGILHWFRAAAAPHRVLIAPEAPSRFYTVMNEGKRIVGASWNTRELLAEETGDHFDYLEQVLGEVARPGTALDIHGFSQGVSVGTRWAVRTSRPIRRIVCWAGSIPADVTGAALRTRLSHDVLDLVVGDQDDRVPPEKVAADADRLSAEGMPTTIHRFAGGHTVDQALVAEFAARRPAE